MPQLIRVLKRRAWAKINLMRAINRLKVIKLEIIARTLERNTRNKSMNMMRKNTMMMKKKIMSQLNSKKPMIHTKSKRKSKTLRAAVKKAAIHSTMERYYHRTSMKRKTIDHLELKEDYKDPEIDEDDPVL